MMNQCSLERNWRTKTNLGHSMLLDILYDATISGISNRLRKAKLLLIPLNRPPYPIVGRKSSISLWSIPMSMEPSQLSFASGLLNHRLEHESPNTEI